MRDTDLELKILEILKEIGSGTVDEVCATLEVQGVKVDTQRVIITLDTLVRDDARVSIARHYVFRER